MIITHHRLARVRVDLILKRRDAQRLVDYLAEAHGIRYQETTDGDPNEG